LSTSSTSSPSNGPANDAADDACDDRPDDASDDLPEVVIRPSRGWVGLDVPELWRNRELLFFLVWRDVKAKYKQAALGFAWALFVPLVSMAIYSIFGSLSGLSGKISKDIPYALYVFAGLTPWLFIQRSLTDGGMSLITQQSLLSKIYMPRLYLPTAAIGNALVDLLISLALLSALAAYFAITQGFVPSRNIVFLPLVLLLAIIAALGLAFLASAAIVMYRDLKFVIPFFGQFGLWLSAVVVPPETLGSYRVWLALNPLAGIISSFRTCIVGTPLDVPLVVSSVVCCPILFVLGVFYFKRVERRFADIA